MWIAVYCSCQGDVSVHRSVCQDGPGCISSRRNPDRDRQTRQHAPVFHVFILNGITLESLKTLEGDPGGTGDKLQQPGSAFLIERLHSFPEPFNDVAVWSAVLESCVGLPVVDVDFTQAAHNQLQRERERKSSIRVNRLTS